MLVRVKQTQTSEVLETSEVSPLVSRAMQKLSISYTKGINKRFDRVGSLFQGSFQAKLIQADAHLQTLCFYIHANPVKDELVDDLESWPYSNYLEWLRKRNGTLLDREFVSQIFGGEQSYQEHICDYLQNRNISEDVRIYLNSIES